MKREKLSFERGIALWLLVVMTCYFLGDVVSIPKEPKFEVWESQNWILHIPDNDLYYYEIQQDEQGKLMFYIEMEEKHSGYCYLDTKTMLFYDEGVQYIDQFRILFDVLFDYYGDRLET